MEVFGPWDEVLNPARQDFVIVGLECQVFKLPALVNCQLWPASPFVVVVQNYELLDLVLRVTPDQLELLLRKLERLADVHPVVDAGSVENTHELLANAVQDHMIVLHTNHVIHSRLTEKFACRFRVTTGNEH